LRWQDGQSCAEESRWAGANGAGVREEKEKPGAQAFLPALTRKKFRPAGLRPGQSSILSQNRASRPEVSLECPAFLR
jgi:hypothetical protein